MISPFDYVFTKFFPLYSYQHVTINYIRAMENLLTTGDSGVRSYSEMVRNPIRPNERRSNKFEQYDDQIADEIMDGCCNDEENGSGEILIRPAPPQPKANKGEI